MKHLFKHQTEQSQIKQSKITRSTVIENTTYGKINKVPGVSHR